MQLKKFVALGCHATKPRVTKQNKTNGVTSKITPANDESRANFKRAYAVFSGNITFATRKNGRSRACF